MRFGQELQIMPQFLTSRRLWEFVIKVVLDTSVFIAALLSKRRNSTPVLLLDKWRDRCFTLVMAPQLLRELVVQLMRKQIPQADIEDLVRLIAEIALHIKQLV